MKVDDIPAGRELDALVAKKVMGWKTEAAYQYVHVFRNDQKPDETSDEYVARSLWRSSSDIKAAFEVANRVEADGWFLRLIGPKYLDSEGKLVDGHDALFLDFRSERLSAQAVAETEALAICRAALKAVGIRGIPDED